MALQTIFGWTLIGSVQTNEPIATQSFFASIDQPSDTITKFLELEVPAKKLVYPDDEQAEIPFQKPLVRHPSERLLASDEPMRVLCHELMADYVTLAHIHELTHIPSGTDGYFIPHQVLVNSENGKPNLRVVLDASSKTEHQPSLIDTIGKLQNDDNILRILGLHWRAIELLQQRAFEDNQIAPVRIDNEEAPHSSCIPEVNSTGSILSNFSYSKSEDDLNISAKFIWKKHRRSTGAAPEQPATKNRRSSGNRFVESWARSEGPPKIVDTKSKQESKNDTGSGQKQHVLQMKFIMMPNNCSLSTLCIPLVNTPNRGNGLGVISDYTGILPPLVPPIIINCINEIERRETEELGLYQVLGSKMDVKALKEGFLRGKVAPCLNDVDVYVFCGVIKDFLGSLEPLVTKNLLKDFVRAAENNNNQMLFQTISELPQSNRDTLAYIILHLQRISEMKEI
ncbi:hypothetical protein WA026_020277 [Henosepilachna vigintioctopunctata]|uniref:Rho-GAP domain-containing protein n=1 Tax=Henosepilachna vigintioctopunctata TaxID=420089 RepID=A0AAW1TWE0_9CUCU